MYSLYVCIFFYHDTVQKPSFLSTTIKMNQWIDEYLLPVCEWLCSNEDDIGRKSILRDIQSDHTMELLLSNPDFRNSLLLSMDMDDPFPAIVIAQQLKTRGFFKDNHEFGSDVDYLNLFEPDM